MLVFKEEFLEKVLEQCQGLHSGVVFIAEIPENKIRRNVKRKVRVNPKQSLEKSEEAQKNLLKKIKNISVYMPDRILEYMKYLLDS